MWRVPHPRGCLALTSAPSPALGRLQNLGRDGIVGRFVRRVVQCEEEGARQCQRDGEQVNRAAPTLNNEQNQSATATYTNVRTLEDLLKAVCR